MSTTPNEPQNPQSGALGQPGPGQSGQPMPYGQGAVNGAPQGGPNGQQYGQAGGKFGTAEYNPGQYTGLMERPSTIDRLLKLTLVSLGISVLSSILSIIGVLTDVHGGEVEIEGEPTGVARVELSQRRTTLEGQRLKGPSAVEVAQEQILSNVDDRGIAALGAGAARGVAGDVPEGETDLIHVVEGSVRGSNGRRVSAICQVAS